MSDAGIIKKTGKHDWRRVDALTDEEVHAVALADLDAQPLTEERVARMKRVPRARTLRRALGLTQEEIAARYHIPIGTLLDWEQGRSEPDQPARAYLNVIAHDPDGARRALESGPTPSKDKKNNPVLAVHTLVEISDSLLRGARRVAAQQGAMLRALIERGLHSVVHEAAGRDSSKLRRASFGGRGRQPEFPDGSWERVRDAIYRDRGA